MSKKVAVIASILKPVNDTRMFEKLGLSIRETNKYHVNIIGFGVKNPPTQQGMSFHNLYQGKRVSLGRLMAPWKFIKLLNKLRPDLVIVCTPELLFPAVIYKLLLSCQLWYDVQENYQRNISYQPTYPAVLKPLLKLGIWIFESSTRPFIDHFVLAERGYAKEMNFADSRHTIAENKFVNSEKVIRPPRSKEITMVFTGTGSKENGLLAAIDLLEKFYQKGYPANLSIVGNIPDQDILQTIKIKIAQGTPIRLVGDGSLVPHSLIMETAAKADFGLVAHRPNPSNENCIPTKIYEYLGLNLPMILQSHTLWESVADPYSAAVVVDYENIDPDDLWYRMHNTRFYDISPGSEISWESEAQKLLPQL
jgi:hypothetical protein